MELFGKHIRQMDVLGEIDGEDYDEVRVCRLAMLAQGEDPANEARVQELLDLPLTEYQDYVDDVLAQIQAGAAFIWQQSGACHVPLASGDTAVVQPLKGRHRRLVGQLDDVHGDRRLMLTMSNLSGDALDALPIGDYHAVMAAVDFLFQPVIDKLMQTPSPETDSSSPSADC